MAEIVTVEGEQYKKRSPFGAWGLGVITLGIYGFVWYYKINDEARRYLKDESIKPGIAVLALIPGFLLIVPPFVSIYRTGGRIERMEEKANIARSVEPVLGLVASLFYALHVPYYQSHLNGVWNVGARRPASLMPEPPEAPTVPPPPPG